MIESKTVHMLFWVVIAITMVLLAFWVFFYFGVKNLNIAVG